MLAMYYTQHQRPGKEKTHGLVEDDVGVGGSLCFEVLSLLAVALPEAVDDVDLDQVANILVERREKEVEIVEVVELPAFRDEGVAEQVCQGDGVSVEGGGQVPDPGELKGRPDLLGSLGGFMLSIAGVIYFGLLLRIGAGFWPVRQPSFLRRGTDGMGQCARCGICAWASSAIIIVETPLGLAVHRLLGFSAGARILVGA